MRLRIQQPRSTGTGNRSVRGKFEKGGGAMITIRSASLSIPQLISAAGKKLCMNARRIFNYEGRELDDVAFVTDGDVLFFSNGEDYISPCINKPQDPGSPTTVIKNFELLKKAPHTCVSLSSWPIVCEGK